jgi:NAD(P)-dependent dehydrogenase (short-subunit alcohol dehydrogenase family)
MADHVAVVTGGGRGTGAAIARRLGAQPAPAALGPEGGRLARLFERPRGADGWRA